MAMPPRPKLMQLDQDALLCDISKAGQLVEFGRDPVTRTREKHTTSVQTEADDGYAQSPVWAGLPFAMVSPLPSRRAMPEVKPVSNNQNATSAAQILKLVVGMLGMEVHERPAAWAEAWLAFQENALAKGRDIGSVRSRGAWHDGQESGSEWSDEDPCEWQLRVLQCLRRRVDAATASQHYPDSEDSQGDEDHTPEWGPEFREHLDLAEFALRRITHAVMALQHSGGPVVLRQFTEEQVMKVCADLRQWLEQLATLLSLYHVHLLDMDNERHHLLELLESRDMHYDQGQKEKRRAALRLQRLQELWEEDTLKRRAAAMLGLEAAPIEEPKIYSQGDLEELQRKWELTELEPVRREVADRRLQVKDLQARLREKDRRRSTRRFSRAEPGKYFDMDALDDDDLEDELDQEERPKDEQPPPIPKATQAPLWAALNSAAERIQDESLSRLVSGLATAVQKGGAGIQNVAGEIAKLKVQDAPRLEYAEKAQDCLSALMKEFEDLDRELRELAAVPGSGDMDKLADLVGWARETSSIVSRVVGGASKTKAASLAEARALHRLDNWPAPPAWNLESFRRAQRPRPLMRAVAVNTDGLLVEPPPEPIVTLVSAKAQVQEAVEDTRKKADQEWQGRLRHLTAGLEEKISLARDTAERERTNAEEALQRLAEESRRADRTMTELRKRQRELEEALHQARVSANGKLISDGVWAPSPAEMTQFREARDVFNRLYTDALNRMKRLAESQAQMYESTSQEFLRCVQSLVEKPTKPIDWGSVWPERDPLVYKDALHTRYAPHAPRSGSRGRREDSPGSGEMRAKRVLVGAGDAQNSMPLPPLECRGQGKKPWSAPAGGDAGISVAPAGGQHFPSRPRTSSPSRGVAVRAGSRPTSRGGLGGLGGLGEVGRPSSVSSAEGEPGLYIRQLNDPQRGSHTDTGAGRWPRRAPCSRRVVPRGQKRAARGPGSVSMPVLGQPPMVVPVTSAVH